MGEKRIWECEDRKRGMEEDGGGVRGGRVKGECKRRMKTRAEW